MENQTVFDITERVEISEIEDAASRGSAGEVIYHAFYLINLSGQHRKDDALRAQTERRLIDGKEWLLGPQDIELFQFLCNQSYSLIKGLRLPTAFDYFANGLITDLRIMVTKGDYVHWFGLKRDRAVFVTPQSEYQARPDTRHFTFTGDQELHVRSLINPTNFGTQLELRLSLDRTQLFQPHIRSISFWRVDQFGTHIAELTEPGHGNDSWMGRSIFLRSTDNRVLQPVGTI